MQVYSNFVIHIHNIPKNIATDIEYIILFNISS